MTHAELVEKVARAICWCQGACFALSGEPCEIGKRTREDARAAIAAIAEALRVPSDAMTTEGADALEDFDRSATGGKYWNANACWRAMLAASPLVQDDKQ